ncbi:MAG: catalase [Clostridia bacterium]|nr:catalase [Oscillospiraceae bacterium]MBQ7960028.1 catalase [Clostridia bacterium]
MKKFFGHLLTVLRHKWKVFVHCCKAGIPWRGLWHDMSKFSPTEFVPGVRFFLGTRSPNEAERARFGYSFAWMHHKGRNRHHFEYWTDYNPKTKTISPVEMPVVFVKEMFCDRVAASKIYQGRNYTEQHPLEYFMKAKGRRIIHPETSDLLEEWLRLLSEKGEKETFRHIRKIKRNMNR